MAFNEYAEERAFLVDNSNTANTAKIYGRAYDKLVKNIGDKPVLVSNADEDFLIQTIKETSDNPETQATLLTIVFKLRANMPNSKLAVYREVNKKDRQKRVISRQADERVKYQGISYQNLLDFNETNYRNKNWIDWVINYLLLNYGVRNEDLMLEITRHYNPAPDGEENKKNYLYVVNGSRIAYIRNSYKTARTYGAQTIQIKDKRFIRVVNEIMYNRKGDFKLLGDIEPAGISQKIIRTTPYKLGEGQMFKILVGHYMKTDQDIFKQLAEWRGTHISTIINSYYRDEEMLQEQKAKTQ